MINVITLKCYSTCFTLDSQTRRLLQFSKTVLQHKSRHCRRDWNGWTWGSVLYQN